MKHFFIALVISISLVTVGACSSSDKPSKKALVESFLKVDNVTSDNDFKAYAECFVDEFYDKVSTKTLNEMLNLSNELNEEKFKKKIGAKDFETVDEAAKSCEDKIPSVETLESAKKSTVKVDLRNGIIGIKSLQTSLGQTDFTGIDIESLTKYDPDILWAKGRASDDSENQGVYLVNLSPSQIVLQSVSSEENRCYFVELNADDATRYGYSDIEENDYCPDLPDESSGSALVTDQKTGWGS